MASPDFTIHEVPVAGGTLALSPLPGRSRHYYTDWLRLMDWAPDRVLTLTEQHELDRKGAGTLGRDLANAGVVWHHLPIPDYGIPDAEFEGKWPTVSADILSTLQGGGRVLAHCFGGCGRSGMAVLRLMIDAGEAGEAALARLRHARPCAVETDAQMDWAMRH